MSTYKHKNTDLYNDSYYMVDIPGNVFFFNMRLNSHEFDQSEITFNYQFHKIFCGDFAMYSSKSLFYLFTPFYSSQKTNPTFQNEGLISVSLLP